MTRSGHRGGDRGATPKRCSWPRLSRAACGRRDVAQRARRVQPRCAPTVPHQRRGRSASGWSRDARYAVTALWRVKNARPRRGGSGRTHRGPGHQRPTQPCGPDGCQAAQTNSRVAAASGAIARPWAYGALAQARRRGHVRDTRDSRRKERFRDVESVHPPGQPRMRTLPPATPPSRSADRPLFSSTGPHPFYPSAVSLRYTVRTTARPAHILVHSTPRGDAYSGHQHAMFCSNFGAFDEVENRGRRPPTLKNKELIITELICCFEKCK